MYCSGCDNDKPIKGKKIDAYKYSESGLDNFILRGVMEYRCPKCGEVSYSFGDMGQLHSKMADILLQKDGLLTGKEVRFLRSNVGYSGSRFAEILGIAAETISRIENEKQSLTVQMDHHIRSAVFNKKPDRSYDLHDKMIDHPIKLPNLITLIWKGGIWDAPSLPAMA